MSKNSRDDNVKHVPADDPRIQHELVKSLYINSGSSLTGSILSVMVLIAIFLGHVSTHALAAWGGYMLAVTLLRYGMLHKYKAGMSGERPSNPWATYFYIGTAMNSAGWGAAAWVLFTQEALLQAIVYITLAGVMSAGVIALAARRMAVVCFLTPITILALLRLVTVNEASHFALAIMLPLFSIFMYRFAATSEQTLVTSLKLRFENKNLLKHLESSNQTLTDTNRKYVELNSELTKMRDEALDLSRAKSEFLATMSHEIRTPMNGVLGMVELLLGTRLSEQQQCFAETVRRSGETLLSIINDLLDFSKIEAGKITIEQTDFNLRTLIEDLGDLFSARAHGKGLELACSVPGNIQEMVVGDSTRLRQILTNLIGNAIKFTETGEVLISAQPLKETDSSVQIRFSVRDTGIGLEASEVDHIFESFTQADSSTTRKYGGTGLGLSISMRLVELMGGKLNVESIAEQGSTFAFELQLDKSQATETLSTTRTVSDFSKLQVLVVDDNTTNLEILSHHLETWDISHTCTGSGQSALELLHAEVNSNNPYNLVILDYHMPEMDGLELAQTINADPELPPTRMVMFSSVDDAVLQQDSHEYGIDYSITKPVRQAELYDCLINRKVSEYRNTDHDNNDENPELLPDQSSKKILVVEDNAVNQAVAVGMLRQLGFRNIHTADNGREALDKSAQTLYDLILMDMQMPVMDGFQATAALRKREQATETDSPAITHMPIIALTANALQGDRERCLDAGTDDYLSKPFSPIGLARLLEKWLPGRSAGETESGRQATLPDVETENVHPVTAPEPGNDQREKSSASALDQSVLDVIRDLESEDAPDIFANIIGLYLDKSPALLQTMQTAIVERDAESLRDAAHTLKSSSANVGALILSALCKELEDMGRAGSLVNSASKLSCLFEEYSRVKTALADELKRNAA